MLAASEINSFLHGELKRLRVKFAALSALDLADGIRAEEARQDRVAAAAIALAAARGPKVDISTSDRARLEAEGLRPAEIDEIQPLLAKYIQARLLPPPEGKMGRLLRERGLQDSEVNRAQAQTLHLRALSIALREQADIYETGFSDDSEHLAAVASAAAREFAPSLFHQEPSLPAPARQPSQAAEPNEQEPSKVSLAALGRKLIAEKVTFKRWTQKTADQAKQTYELFGKSLGHDDLSGLSQRDVSDFKDLLLELPKTYGKSSKDRELTAAQLRANGATLSSEQRGLGVDAINRHLNFLGQLFAAVRAQGIALDPKINPAALRAKEDADPMDEVLPWGRDHRTALYAQPPFVGCGSWKRRMQPGATLFHDGLYWCPLLCDYHGFRREEAAGLAVEDVVQDEDTGVWAIEVRLNQFRRLKRTWTARRIPIHAELIRLKFLEYVQAIRALGYAALFPDLLPARSGAPLGEQFSDGWARIEAGAFPDGKPEKHAFRSFRHTFNKELKDAGVSLELRAELMGHKKQGETAGRYGDRFNIRLKAEAMSKLPTLTAHLPASDIILLPPVAARQPIRRPRRSRREKPPSE